MKKFLIAAFAMLTLSVAFTSCDDDEGGNSNFNIIADPASVVSGTYSGTYTRTLDGVPETGNGAISIAAGSSKEYVNVTFQACSAMGLSEVTVPCNIAQKGDRFIITNGAGAKNALGTSFRIFVDNSKDMTANFKLTVKNGRKAYEYDFEFLGNK